MDIIYIYTPVNSEQLPKLMAQKAVIYLGFLT